ncbi:non-hydrolyzing UDP-N-acetylglucosamine 2-epimerase [Peribacillus tepidiphilus]|uniref:non-hydrolyzing UDP-N-acetylglucosamine 2-epimerase n=1 Tax=Peribacillus tepidiphilus TaxID=2652445 RepID=UPI0035B50054
MTIVGTRPELIKLSMVIRELEKHTEHILVHTGQNFDYELNEIFFKELGITKPDYFLNAAGKSPAETIGNILAKTDIILEKEKPDALLIYGDTNSCLSVIAAKRRKIPIFHMEAGNRCFDQRVPEEINRKIVDHLSDINLPITEHARRYLINEGIKPETIIKVGSSMREILEFYKPKILNSNILTNLNLEKKNYFLISAHREENIDSDLNFNDFLQTLNLLADKYDMPLIVSTHPRTRKRLEVQDKKMDRRIQFLKPLGFFDYIHLQIHSFCVISDSGTITEEASILGFPAITIRQAHERPEGMDEGVLIMSGLKPESVLECIQIITSQESSKIQNHKMVPDYETENVSNKIVRIIFSYVDYINRTVWFK